ncbi:Protein of unknown function [Gryllus bimaculatus]|nr:Protein of unknown function [Gryllus bimaculatus]
MPAVTTFGRLHPEEWSQDSFSFITLPHQNSKAHKQGNDNIFTDWTNIACQKQKVEGILENVNRKMYAK